MEGLEKLAKEKKDKGFWGTGAGAGAMLGGGAGMIADSADEHFRHGPGKTPSGKNVSKKKTMQLIREARRARLDKFKGKVGKGALIGAGLGLGGTLLHKYLTGETEKKAFVEGFSKTAGKIGFVKKWGNKLLGKKNMAATTKKYRGAKKWVKANPGKSLGAAGAVGVGTGVAVSGGGRNINVTNTNY